jgi:hypothetical protein
MGVSFLRGPLLGKIEGRSFLRDLVINRYIKRYVKMPCYWVSLSTRKLEVILLPGLLERKG